MEKYIFMDCDGTLVPYIGSIPESAKKALAQAKINGSKLFLATGRYLDELDDEILDIGFEGLILNGGNYIQYKGKDIYNGSFSLEDEKKLVDYFETNKLDYRLETANQTYETKGFNLFNDEDDEKDSSIIEITSENKYRNDVVSINVAVNNDNYYNLALAFENHLVYGYKNDEQYCLAVINRKGINKGTAIKFLIDFLHIKKEDTISIGDDYNDIEMFKQTGFSIAVKSGNELAKKQADYITDTPSNDGIEKALKHFKLI